MARQVRPWPAQPVEVRAPRVRSADRGVGQRIPSGTTGICPNQEAGYMAAIFPFSPSTMRELCKIEDEQKLPLGPQDWDLLADRALTAQPQQTRSIDSVIRAAQGRHPSDPCTSAHDLRLTRTPDRCHAPPLGCLAKTIAAGYLHRSEWHDQRATKAPACAAARTPWC